MAESLGVPGRLLFPEGEAFREPGTDSVGGGSRGWRLSIDSTGWIEEFMRETWRGAAGAVGGAYSGARSPADSGAGFEKRPDNARCARGVFVSRPLDSEELLD